MDLLKRHFDMLKLEGITEINFRPKILSWVDYFVVRHSRGERKIYWTLDEYFYCFEKSISIRRACMNCEHCNGARSADITLADFWGVLKYDAQKYDPKGISLILCNTNFGQSILNDVIESGKITVQSLPLPHAEYVYAKKRAKETGYDNEARDRFISEIYSIGYKNALKREGIYISPFKKMISSTKDCLRRLYGKLVSK